MKTLILVDVWPNGHTQVIGEGTGAALGLRKKKLQNEIQYKGHRLQIRTKEGYKAKKIL